MPKIEKIEDFYKKKVGWVPDTIHSNITERILYEAKILLKQSDWNIAEIAHVLGFAEASHFNNYFKKHTRLTPTQFRNL